MQSTRRFVFWSWTYASGVGMMLLMAAIVTALAASSLSWLAVVVLGVPLALCWYAARRARVVVALRGDRLTVLAGIGPKRTLMLRADDRTMGEGPYREGDVGSVNRSEVAVVDHQEVDGPVIKENTPLTRGIGSALRLIQLMVRRHDYGESTPISEAMGKVSVVAQDGKPHHFVVPAEGSKNEASLAALLAALNGTEEPSDAA